MPRLSQQEFDELVERSMRVIPQRFRKRLKNLVFIVEAEPPRPGLLGLYEGRPLPVRSVFEGFTQPDRITIFQRPHERIARDLQDLERLVQETIWHEVAHYFGMDEVRVRRAEGVRRVRQSRRDPQV